MAMTPAGLSARLYADLQGKFTILDDDILQRFCDACGDAIVTYIQDQAEVLPDTLANNSGQPVHVDPGSGDGATSSPQIIIGKGKVS